MVNMKSKSLENQIRPRIYDMSFASVYKLYITKAERKNRTKAEVDEIILWLTGYTPEQFEKQQENMLNFEEFFAGAKLNPLRTSVTGVICGIRVEDMPDSLMKEIRYMDKLVDELAKGKSMDKILRKL
jgi:hypothetical protein